MATLLQNTAYVRTFPMYLTGTKTPATGKTVAVVLSKAGAAFGAAAGAVAEISVGWYKVSLTTADTDTLNDLAYHCTNVDCDPTDFTDQVGPIPANLKQIDELATNINAATLNLKQLNCVNSAGDAAVFSSTGSNGSGVVMSGNGSGPGLSTTGGNTGHGANFVGGATSGSGANFQAVGAGNGMTATGTSNGAGAVFLGNGTGSGVFAQGGNTGHGANLVGGATSGSGFYANEVGNGAGFTAIGVGSVSILATQGISGPLDTATYNAITDNALLRDYTAVSSGAAPSFCTMNAMRSLRHWDVSGSTYTAYAEDATTPVFTVTLTTDAAALAVVKFGVA